MHSSTNTARDTMMQALAWAKSAGLKTGGGRTQIRPSDPDADDWAYLPYLPLRTARAIKARFGAAVVVRRHSDR